MENKKSVTVLKIGGNIIDNPTDLKQFLIAIIKIVEKQLNFCA